MMEWLLKLWGKLLGYTSCVSKLENGWSCFHLMKDNDVGEVMCRTWVNRRCFLALHHWDAGFHPILNAPINHLMWVKLYGLHIQFWSTKVLAVIGDCIGKCHFVDPKCTGPYDKRAVWILVEAPFAGSLPAHINLL